jgi:Cu-Zn family superoxide dismutase
MRMLVSSAVFAAFAGAAFPQTTPETSQLSAQILGKGGKPAGTLALTDTPHGVLMVATIEAGALPAGEHAIHIHATGDCSDTEKFEQAGSHYNPAEAEHGYLVEKGPHAGDLPNLVVVDGEKTEVSFFTPMVRFEEGDAPLFDGDGSAVVVHAGADDYESQPSGDSGDRIACAALTGG